MFSHEICKNFRNTFFIEYLRWLLLTVLGFQPATLFKKRLRQRYFSMNFTRFLRKSFDRTPPDDCFLCLSVNFERSFLENLFYRAPLENYLFHVKVAEFQLANKVKNYFIGVFQVFYTRTRSNHSKAFIYIKNPLNYL